MLLIDNDVVKDVLSMRECIEAQERAFAGVNLGTAVSRPRLDTFVPCGREDGYYRFGSLEGASDGVYAVRLKSDIMTWPKRPDGTQSELKYCIEPGTYCGLVILFSSQNGEPLAIMNDGYLQHMRVGGSTGIGARLLSRPESSSIGLIGSGGMARSTLEAMVVVRDIREVKVFSRTPENAQRFATEMSEELKINVVAVPTARDAVRGVDILATATDTMIPIVQADWLEPGMHVVYLGPTDLSPEALARIDYTVLQGVEAFDLPESANFRKGVGHSRAAFITGTPEQQARLPIKTPKKGRELPLYTDVIAGRAQGRTSPTQITSYRAVGNWGLQFSSCGEIIYRRAKERGLGRHFPTEWFLQDIKN
jgi:alanine dehydrogenase